MKSIWVCSGLVFLSGCLTSDGITTVSQSDKNIANLGRISLGMDEGDVMQRMHRPYAEESYTIGEDQYDIWFYVTNPTILGQSKMVHYNLTPLTFKNDILTAIGWDYYKWVKEQSQLPPQPIVPAITVPSTQVIGTQPTDSTDDTPAPDSTNSNDDTNVEKVSEPSDSNNDSNTPAEDADIEKILDDAHDEPQSAPTTIPATVQPVDETPDQTPASPCLKHCPGLLEAMNSQKVDESKKADEKKKKEKEKKEVDMDQEDEDFQDQERQQETNFW